MRRGQRLKQGGFIGSLIGGLVTGAMSLFGGERRNSAQQDMNSANNAFNAEQAQLNREWSSAEAEENRAFQLESSATQYQRAVDDLKKAGLNPMLAYTQGGAGNLSGAMGQSSAASAAGTPQMQDTVTPAVSSAMQAAQVQNQIQLGEAQKELLEAQAFKARAEAWNTAADYEGVTHRVARDKRLVDNIEADTLNKNMSAEQLTQSAELLAQTVPKIKAEIEKLKEETTHERLKQTLTAASEHLTRVETLYKRGQISQQRYEESIKQLTDEIMRTAGVPAARNRAAAEESYLGQFRSYLGLNDVLDIIRNLPRK